MQFNKSPKNNSTLISTLANLIAFRNFTLIIFHELNYRDLFTMNKKSLLKLRDFIQLQ